MGRKNKRESENTGFRTTIEVQGSRVHNLNNVSVEIPRDKLIVVTGLSGSGKSSLAFDTIYAEGQRRYMESLSSFARRFVSQVEKPDVDFVYGLSPVVSIEQKTIARNPRSTVGTLTDVSSYLNLLYATVATAKCPYTDEEVPIKTSSNILESILALPLGTVIELRVPIFLVYGEEASFLFTEVRKKGCRSVIIDGERVDLTDEVPESVEMNAQMYAVVDRFTIIEGIDKQLKTSIEHALRVGDSLMTVEIVDGLSKKAQSTFLKAFGSRKFNLVFGDIVPDYFMFNKPESACRTCGGIGTTKFTHKDLLVTNPENSLREGCFLRAAYSYNPEAHSGYSLYTVCQEKGIDMDSPWQDLSEESQEIILQGLQGERLQLQIPPESKDKKERWLRWPINFSGVAGGIERRYRWYRQQDVPNANMERWLDRVMVERICEDCGGSRLRRSRLLFEVGGKNIYELGQMNFDELYVFLNRLELEGSQAEAGNQIKTEILKRIDLLLGIGLDYLNFNRASGTLSGGEAQRIRLSTQIGSGLMGMLYVLDEPSIGLHPKDNTKMISTLRALRDLGNTVIVVEHDEATIRAADHVVEIGPGPGIHGGNVVIQGELEDILTHEKSPTGQYLSGNRKIDTPTERREVNGQQLSIYGASENNLKDIDVDIPLGVFVCITGASGSGKSTLINEILYKELWKQLVDTRSLSGAHRSLEGVENLTRVINIDQTPIGRSSRSNPSTYIGVYDEIRKLFSQADVSKERGYKPGRFSFNVKGGRCEECQGEGSISTKLYFMPDVEVTCAVCKGQRFNSDTLEVTYHDKSIAEILDLSIEDAVGFFDAEPKIARKIKVLNDLGLGYLTLGQSATTLSGGEAQRVKLAGELAKLQNRGHILYILDEPTTGLHLADISNLLNCLHQLVDAGHSVLCIEHHLDVIKTADHVIDLGPEGGRGGGEVIAQGTPEHIAQVAHSHTGQYLQSHL